MKVKLPSMEDIDLWMSKYLPIRIIYDSIKRFLREHCTIRATALAYTSLLAVVPLLILITSISFSLGFGEVFVNHLPEYLPLILEKFMPYADNILHKFLPSSEVDLNVVASTILESVMPYLNKAMEIRINSLGGAIGGIGLLVTFILAIDSIETNMNIVWGINKTRSYFQKAAVFIPFLFLLAGIIGIVSLFLSYTQNILEGVLTQKHSFGEFGSLLVNMSIIIAFLAVILVGLWLLYCYMPYASEGSGFWRAAVIKTKRRWRASLISAVFTFIAASLFTVAMFLLQAKMFAKWSLFYGSLAIVPMLMFWLFGFWSIVLFGNALCWRITEEFKLKLKKPSA